MNTPHQPTGLRAGPETALATIKTARALINQGRNTEAAAMLTAALASMGHFGSIRATLGDVLCRLGRYRDAIPHLEAALAQDPDHAPSQFYIGVALHATEQHTKAIPHLQRAINLSPQMTDAYRILAGTLQAMKSYADAIKVLDAARANGAASGLTEALCFHLRQMLADWSDFDQSVARIRALKAVNYSGLDSPIALTIPGITLAEQREIAYFHGTRFAGPPLPPPMPVADPLRKIRLGYLSADFYDHPVGRHMLGILEHHDRARFEVFAYSLSPDKDDATTRRLRAAPQRFVDLRSSTDDEAAASIRRDEIEILIDLGGYTEGTRPGLPSRRPAPVQVSYLGFSGTTGHRFHDYIIIDPVTCPPEMQPYYSETFAWLPQTLFNADHGSAYPERVSNRGRWELPADAFVFCAFNNTTKMTPQLFHIWMEILRAVPASVLWIRKIHPTADQRMKKEAAAQGIDPARLVFCATSSREEHLQRLASADLFLDSHPYGAGSTAADALWAGLPILTCAGETYVSRMCASQVVALGLPELVVPTLEAYRARAIELASQPAALGALRTRLLENRPTAILFDSRRFTRQFEDVLAEMSRRSRMGLPHTTPIVPPTP